MPRWSRTSSPRRLLSSSARWRCAKPLTVTVRPRRHWCFPRTVSDLAPELRRFHSDKGEVPMHPLVTFARWRSVSRWACQGQRRRELDHLPSGAKRQQQGWSSGQQRQSSTLRPPRRGATLFHRRQCGSIDLRRQPGAVPPVLRGRPGVVGAGQSAVKGSWFTGNDSCRCWRGGEILTASARFI